MAVALEPPAARIATPVRPSAAGAMPVRAEAGLAERPGARRLDRLHEQVGKLPPLAVPGRSHGADVLTPSRPPGVLQRCGPAGCECGGACGAPKTAPPVQRLTMSASDAASEVEAEMLAPRLASGGSGPTLRRAAAEGTLPVPAHVEQGVARMEGRGAPLDAATRATMERGLGTDLSHVRVHTGPDVIRLARAVDAQAFTVGSDVFMGGVSTGDSHVLAHELVHVAQQEPALSRRTLHRRWPFGGKRKSKEGVALEQWEQQEAMKPKKNDPRTWKGPNDCCRREYCGAFETEGNGFPTSFTLELAVDKESSNIAKGFLTTAVGHTWVRFKSDAGDYASYGLYPKHRYNAFVQGKSGGGCIHHPDRSHEGLYGTDVKEITYNLTREKWDKALSYAADRCEQGSQKYNIFTNNCTTFAADVAREAGVTPPAKSWMAIDNPNSMYESIEAEEEAQEQDALEEARQKAEEDKARLNERLNARFGPATAQ